MRTKQPSEPLKMQLGASYYRILCILYDFIFSQRRHSKERGKKQNKNTTAREFIRIGTILGIATYRNLFLLSLYRRRRRSIQQYLYLN